VAEEILTEHWERISRLEIVPFTDGRFVVKVNGRQVFSKAEAGRFPNKGEAAKLVG
jgi:selT/selW/selH-like putative selenoprotein